MIGACKEEGIGAGAVYSDGDQMAPHVRGADLVVPIGPGQAAEYYLNITKLVGVALDTGCQGVHPGYGFLAERAPFADAVTAAGLVFVGPPAAAIRAMGDKTGARRRLQAAGGPIRPGPPTPVAAQP